MLRSQPGLKESPCAKMVCQKGWLAMANKLGKAPCHLYQRGNAFYFRLVIPAGLRSLLGRHEFRCSLGCLPLKEARRKAAKLEAKACKLLEGVREEWLLEKLTIEQIREIASKWYEETLEETELSRFTREGNRADSEVLRERNEREAEALGFLESDLREALANGVIPKGTEEMAQELLGKREIKVEASSREYLLLARELLIAEIKWHQVVQKRRLGIYAPGQDHLYPDFSERAYLSSIAVSQGRQQEDPGATLGELRDRYLAEAERGGKWKVKKSADENRAIIGNFVELVGEDIPAASLSSEHIRDFKEKLLRLPANVSKRREYRGKTLEELLQMEIPREHLLSNTTLKNRAVKINAFLHWGEKQGYITKPFLNEILEFKGDSSDRAPFTKADLEKLFDPEQYLKYTKLNPAHFWVPLIALFTGARIEEICQLHVDDLRVEEGLWCIDINDTEEEGGVTPGKRLKTSASRRLVPMHNFLAKELGLPRYAEELRQAGEVQLFPGLVRVKGKLSHGVSQWFGRYKKGLGFPAGKVFHSFRNTLATFCKHKGINRVFVQDVLGHKAQNVTFGVYAKMITPPGQLYENVISQVDFEIDLTLLKRSPHARPEVREKGFPATPYKKEPRGRSRKRQAAGKGKKGKQSG